MTASVCCPSSGAGARTAFGALLSRQTHTGIPWRLSNAPNGVRAPAPLLGQHTDAVMRDILGYSDAEIARLREDRILF